LNGILNTFLTLIREFLLRHMYVNRYFRQSL